ncbi:prepilin-type N-terminal cleavage/methylation domain-containing protein [Cognatazoarcus halotolerans]|uniref:prepilin-type N-terminal cleavage/methylation domain-containing protein n=1 Tax=Cognatazoarcus halotolerans TaxID=2686016 RepID=UPI00135AD831|nr:prepilin-type N-terminal cleavage/methylation domain-containing protein [Cognatazoarcus halotolerans]MBX3678609.1 prepilin-type N-terminal cleavage/methylation domain-containing protein [Rhodocyclaceae bacterium]MCB1899364.1 prepilin-type N-terminal cleavage/methylation domain-containing protein [Rhodocyclaceae bacterium]MCP5308548.1 prepilin-type N-terminal cleavage/methylation domain-containing protein [Zoogloeaceae bacterium]
MVRQQSGFTLVEMAVVLVIIGLLLGGVLKGQELINSAKAKSLVNDFRATATFLYGYQDRFRALPGDDAAADTHIGGVKATTGGTLGNGRIEGAWDSTTETDESVLFWQHVRLANLTSGTTTAPTAATILAWLPRNAEGGRIGITSTVPITGLTGSFFVCQGSLSGRFARQIDTTMDDGISNTGTVQLTTEATKPTASATVTDTGTYTVCVAY